MPSVPSFRATSDPLQPSAPAPGQKAEGVRFRLHVRSLSLEDYLAMQTAMTGRHIPGARMDSGLLWLGVIAVVGGGMIAASFLLGITSGFHIDVTAWDWSTTISGGPMVIGIAVIAALTWLAASMRYQSIFLTYAESLHAEGPGLFGPQDIVLTDEGIACTNGTGTHFIRWSAMGDLILLNGIWFAIVRGGIAVWIPEAAIRTSVDPEGLLAFLKDRIESKAP